MISFVEFVTRVIRAPLTPAQSALARVAFDRVEPRDLEGEERAVARELFGDVETIPPSARSVLVAVLGARSGKSYLFVAAYSLWRALTADLSTLAPGERAVALIVAPDLRLARQTLRYVSGSISAAPELSRLGISNSSDSIILRRPDGHEVAIEVLPATRGGSALRGRSLVSACLDECAFFRDENFTVNDGELFRAVSPRILPGGLVVLTSTPFLEQGLFFELADRNFGKPSDALAAIGPTLTMLPTERNQEVVAREQIRDPDNARREFGAQFVTGGSSQLFPPSLLQACFCGEDLVSPRFAKTVLGGDLGLVADASAFVPVHAFPGSPAFHVGELLELRPRKGEPLKLSSVIERAAGFADRYRTNRIWVDHHLLPAAREHCPPGLLLQPVPGGQEAKAHRFLTLRNLMQEEKLFFPASAHRLKLQLSEVQTRPSPGGGLQVLQRRRGGAHGDLVSSLTNAVWAAARGAAYDWTAPAAKEARSFGFVGREKASEMKGF